MSSATIHVSDVSRVDSRRELLVRTPHDTAVLYFDSGATSMPERSTLDDALLALLPLAQFRSWTLQLHGPVSRDLLANMREYQDAWVQLRPDIYSIVDIAAEDTVARTSVTAPRSAMLAFSGGVDSTYALYALAAEDSPVGIDIDAGVLVMGMDIELGDRDAQTGATRAASAILGAFDTDLITLETNWRRDFCPNYTMSFGLGLAACIFQFEPITDSGIIAADTTYSQERGPWGRSATIDWLCGHRAFPMLRIGATTTRRDKIAALAGSHIIRDHIRVCYQPSIADLNCGRCSKCVRTSAAFAQAGHRSTRALGEFDPDMLLDIDLSDWDRLYLRELIDDPGSLTHEDVDTIAAALIVDDGRPSDQDPR